MVQGVLDATCYKTAMEATLNVSCIMSLLSFTCPAAALKLTPSKILLPGLWNNNGAPREISEPTEEQQ